MSYTPTVWANGDTITAQKLNKMENGIAEGGGGGGAFMVYDVEGILDKTWQEIWDAAEVGPVTVVTVSTSTEITHARAEAVIGDDSDPNDPFYGVNVSGGSIYSTTTASGYPELES